MRDKVEARTGVGGGDGTYDHGLSRRSLKKNASYEMSWEVLSDNEN